MHARGLVLLFAVAALAQAQRLQGDTALNIPGYRLVWNDEFEGTAVDPARWDVNVGVNAWYKRASDGRFVEPHWFNEAFAPWTEAGTINYERQYYSPDNVSVRDGLLEITARAETVQNPVGLYDPNYHRYTSGKLNSADEFQFRFGIVKWRAQLPSGQGLWPALWMLNAPNPWYWDDEIDVMEGRGSQPTVTTSAHHFKVGPDNANQYNSGTLDTGRNLQQGFNEYGLEWTASSIRTWINDQTVFTDTVAIPQGPMFLIMNAAVGGHFDGVPASDAIFPTQFRIDWVRVWQPASQPEDLSSGGFEAFQGPNWADWNTQDSGNLHSFTTAPLHGGASIAIGWRSTATQPPVSAPDTNLLTDGTAGPWSAWVNLFDASGNETSSTSASPSSIPAYGSGDSATLSLHQSASASGANSVLYRQIDGSTLFGKSVVFSGTVLIEEGFATGTQANAFIRIFDPSYSYTDVKMSVLAGGQFRLESTIPSSNVPIVQFGFETTGPIGSAGRLHATGLLLQEPDPNATDPAPLPQTGFQQTVFAQPDQRVRYGVLAANHPTDPLGPAAHGRLRLEFLDNAQTPISEIITPIVDEASPAHAVPFIRDAITPASTAFVRLSIERVTLDEASDLGGAFLADVAFLQSVEDTALPLVTDRPPSRVVLREGESLSLSIGIQSSDPVTFTWYRDGQPIASTKDLSLTASPAHAGTYHLVAENSAGPLIGAISEVFVIDPGPDSDGDGISDTDESQRFHTNPSQRDSDGDGQSDYEELFFTQTNPNNPTSKLGISAFYLNSGSPSLQFDSVPGLSYLLQASTDLLNWVSIGDPITASSSSSFFHDLPSPSSPHSFFRVSLAP